MIKRGESELIKYKENMLKIEISLNCHIIDRMLKAWVGNIMLGKI